MNAFGLIPEILRKSQIPAVVVLVALFSAETIAQTCFNPELLHDLDLASKFDVESLCYEACQRVRCGVGIDRYDEVNYFTGNDVLYASVPSLSFTECQSSLVCDGFSVLAWKHERPIGLLNVESSGYVTVLILVHANDSAGAEVWVLMEMLYYPSGQDSKWGLKNGVGADGRVYTMRVFDHVPSNKDIYSVLNEWTITFGGAFFKPDLNARFYWCAPVYVRVKDRMVIQTKEVEFEFIDGDVQEQTWEAVIGEKPTRFFPNGK